MPPFPEMMKGVAITENGGTEVLHLREDLPVPKPADGEILIRNDFIGVNYIDTYFRSGLYKTSHWPYILGCESEGTVVSLGTGDISDFRPGDRVVCFSQATYAEYTVASAARTAKIPAEVAAKIGAAALIQGLTALTLVRDAHHVKKGDWVLVHAAAGGTGLWLCQLLRTIGATVIGTTSTLEKAELAKQAGATYAVNSSREDVLSTVHSLTDGKGVAVVFDGVGKSTFDISMACVARKGSLVSFGNASGAVPPFAIARLSAKNVRLLRPTLGNYVATKEEFRRYTDELFQYISTGDVNVRVHASYPLSRVAEAHMDLENRRTTGKLILDPSIQEGDRS
ncbi:NAD(P)-binding protein [Hortaea werneckii]|uniref:Probable quinone oxidoreductase n=1 Tax=Hortaea werneckii TaxID=91943 RepID=A0A3M7D1M4_HORWE|nr:NAD(P)-binding protein [Hortaea werneckii]KAI7717174.1 NAD(P)-binding protein [Hortaea werneckii]RMY58201.1 hypothetical protein D0865_02733 [Hortaea werneckii]